MQKVRRASGEGHFRNYRSNAKAIDRAVIDKLWSFREALNELRGLGLTDSAAKHTLRGVILNLWELRELEKFSDKRRQSAAAKNESAGRVYEHVIPMNEITEQLLSVGSQEKFEQVVRNRVVTCIVTRREHRELEKKGFRQKSPPDTTVEDIFARYRDLIAFDS